MLKPNSSSVRDVRFSFSNINTLAGAFEDGSIQVWDLRKPNCAVRKIVGHNGPVLGLDFHPGTHRLLASGGRDRIVQVRMATRSSLLSVN